MTRDRTVSVRIGGRLLNLAFTPDEYVALYSAAALEKRTVSEFICRATSEAAAASPVAAAAAAARLPLAAWVRVVVLARLGLSSLGEQLAVFG